MNYIMLLHPMQWRHDLMSQSNPQLVGVHHHWCIGGWAGLLSLWHVTCSHNRHHC